MNGLGCLGTLTNTYTHVTEYKIFVGLGKHDFVLLTRS